jgi:ZIP family zinc transporter/zinc and cadmium transporter
MFEMDARLLILFLLGLAASLANLVGGWIISSRQEIRWTVLNAFISVGAGFMLAASILEVIPRSLRMNESAGIIILAGYLFVHLVEHTMASHFHYGEETHSEQVIQAHSAYPAIAGLALHAFFDGALIGAGFKVSMRLGILMFLAIILHKIPEGFTAASIMRASGRGRLAAILAATTISLSTFAGVVVIAFTQVLAGNALAFSAGVTLYVAASDLIPEVNKEYGFRVSIGVFFGVIFFFLTDTLLERFL